MPIHAIRQSKRFRVIALGVMSGALPWLTQPAVAEGSASQEQAQFSRWIAPPSAGKPADLAASVENEAGRGQELRARPDDLVFDEVDLVDRFLTEDPPEPSLQAARPGNAANTRRQTDDPEPSSAGKSTTLPAWPSEPRVVLHAATRSTPLADFFMDELATRADVSLEKRQVDIDVSASHLRYFHRRDASTAADLALTLGNIDAPLPVKDFTHYRPQPHRGLIEVWVQGPGSN